MTSFFDDYLNFFNTYRDCLYSYKNCLIYYFDKFDDEIKSIIDENCKIITGNLERIHILENENNNLRTEINDNIITMQQYEKILEETQNYKNVLN